MTSAVDLVDGLIGIAVANSLGVYNATGAYSATQVGLTVAAMPATPDLIVALTPYPVDENATLNDSITAVQFKFRGTQDPRSVLDRSAAYFNVFQGLFGQDFGAIHLALMWRQSGVFMGQDDNNRWLYADNYYCRLNWPTANRPD